MPAAERPRYLPVTHTLVPDALLSYHLGQRSQELRPLVRQRLAGLMRADVESISLNDEGVLRVILSGDAAVTQLALLNEPPVGDGEFLFISCDLREAFDFLEGFTTAQEDPLPVHPVNEMLVHWLLDKLENPEIAIELGLVDEGAVTVLERLYEQRETLDQQHRAIEVLSSLCERFAAAALRAPEANLEECVIDALKHQPPQGMVDGEPSYWDEIHGFTDDINELPPRAIEDIRASVVSAFKSLPNDLRLALACREVGVLDWIMQKIEDGDVPYGDLVSFDSEDVVARIVGDIVHRALEFEPVVAREQMTVNKELF